MRLRLLSVHRARLRAAKSVGASVGESVVFAVADAGGPRQEVDLCWFADDVGRTAGVSAGTVVVYSVVGRVDQAHVLAEREAEGIAVDHERINDRYAAWGRRSASSDLSLRPSSQVSPPEITRRLG